MKNFNEGKKNNNNKKKRIKSLTWIIPHSVKEDFTMR